MGIMQRLLILLFLWCLPASFAEPLKGIVSNVEGMIGIRMSSSGGVILVHPDSPAYRSGILAKDKIVSVDGKKNAFDDITGAPGTTVRLEVRRGQKTLFFTVERVDYREIHH